MSRKINFGVGEYYHVYNRGNDRRAIFLDNPDHERFKRSLFLLNSPVSIEMRHYGGEASAKVYTTDKHTEQLVDIGAYCLMPNHFHLLVRERVEGGLSRFAHKLSTSYSMYFNTKHKRTGALFEGPFKAKHITDDENLRYLFAYIHLNPIKIVESAWPELDIAQVSQAAGHLGNYHYSSYLDYLGHDRPERLILNRKAFPEYFAEPRDFGSFIKDWLLHRAEQAYGGEASVVDDGENEKEASETRVVSGFDWLED